MSPSTPYGGGRVGGKVRKPASRKPPATPYARPEQNQSQRRWFSKLVDPAYRLIAGGATRLLPYFFSKSPPAIALPPLEDVDQDQVEAEFKDNVSGEEPYNVNVNQGASTSAGLPGPSREANRPENNSFLDGCQKDREKDALARNGNFDVEKWIQGKTFSRDEVSRLLEIIKSRALEPSNEVENNEVLLQSIGKPTEQPSAANRVLKMPREEKQEDLEKAMLGNITPPPHPLKLNEVGASPVDIARAYMSNRKFEPGLLSDKIPDDERASLHGDHQMSKPFTPSMSPSPSICWPGAMSESQCSYLTPRSQRSRFGLHNIPRTPYSRSIFSKSKSKLTQVQGDTQKFMNTTPLWQQSRTPAYAQMTSSNEPLDEATGSIGPIRRLRHKASAVTNSKRSPYFYPTRQAETTTDNSNVSEGILPNKKYLELGGASTIPPSHSVGFNNSKSSLLTVHPQSSQVARSILEHISRNPPTPKEKTEELKRAIEWKKPQSSNVQTVEPNETSTLDAELHSRREANKVDQNRHSQMSDKRKTVSAVQTKENADRKSDAVNKNSPDLKFSNADWKHKDDAGLKSNNLSPKDASPKIVSAFGSGVGTQIKSFPSNGTKPGFPSITINKPEPKWSFSSNSGSAFTFPVSGAASSGGLSEPPTPSMFPSTNLGGSQSLLLKPVPAVPSYSFGSKKSNPEPVPAVPSYSFGSKKSHPEPMPAVPSYSFGSKKSNPALVFSFPSTNGDTIHTDASDIKFSFGSDDTKKRLSFSSVGKDAVCC